MCSSHLQTAFTFTPPLQPRDEFGSDPLWWQRRILLFPNPYTTPSPCPPINPTGHQGASQSARGSELISSVVFLKKGWTATAAPYCDRSWKTWTSSAIFVSVNPEAHDKGNMLKKEEHMALVRWMSRQWPLATDRQLHDAFPLLSVLSVSSSHYQIGHTYFTGMNVFPFCL